MGLMGVMGDETTLARPERTQARVAISRKTTSSRDTALMHLARLPYRLPLCDIMVLKGSRKSWFSLFFWYIF